MSPPTRPPSQASTVAVAESAPASAEKDTALPHAIDEKLDPWLVSFSPGDLDNPLVRPFPPVSLLSAFLNVSI